MKNKRIRISYSAVTDFKACPQKYYYKKQYRTKLKASALAFGNATEDAVTRILKTNSLVEGLKVFKKEWYCSSPNKWQGEQMIFDSNLIFYYLSDYDAQVLTRGDKLLVKEWCEELLEKPVPEDMIKDAIVKIKSNKQLDERLRKFYHRVAWLCCRRRGLLMVKAFYDNILPEVEEVLACQKTVDMENEDGDCTVGYIDYVLKIRGYDEPIIFDLKAAGKFYEQHDLVTTDQLRSYAAAEGNNYIGYLILFKKIKHEKLCSTCGHLRDNGRLKNCAECKKGRYDIIRSKALTQLLVRELEESDVEAVIDDFTDITMAIKSGLVWKNPNACNNFNTRCEFYDVCWGDKKLEDLEHLEPTNKNKKGKK